MKKFKKGDKVELIDGLLLHTSYAHRNGSENSLNNLMKSIKPPLTISGDTYLGFKIKEDKRGFGWPSSMLKLYKRDNIGLLKVL